jgi:VanZ family protein
MAHIRVSPRGRLVVNLAYAAGLLALGLTPEVPIVGAAVPDFLVHCLATGAQTLILFWLLSTAVSPTSAVISSGLGAFLFGAFVEVLQKFQPTRYFQPSDLAASAIGSVLVCMAIGLWLAYNRKNLRPAP